MISFNFFHKMRVRRYLFITAILLGLLVGLLLVAGGLSSLTRDNPSQSVLYYEDQICTNVWGLLCYLYSAWAVAAGAILLLNFADLFSKNRLTIKFRLAVSAAIFVAMTLTGVGYFAKIKKNKDWPLHNEKTCRKMVYDCELTF